MKILYTTLFIVAAFQISAQNGVIKGKVTDTKSNKPIEFVDIFLYDDKDSSIIASGLTDSSGSYALENLEPGLYTVEASFISYKTIQRSEIQAVNNKPTVVNFELEEQSEEIKEVVVKANPFQKPAQSPLSSRSIGITEIRRNPGAAQDISKVFKILPGVTAPPVTFRNDLFIRGGGPNENSFYLDGVQVPVINHFTTQGSSGGPAGMINTEFIRNVEFLSSAFPANRNNSLSSVFNFQFRDGRDDRLGGTFNLGSTNAGLTFEGPIGENTTFLASVRRSYLQLLFSIIDLPFLPSYWDFQAKVEHKINANNEITFIGLGAIDKLRLNLEAYTSESNAASLENIPELDQWNYTNGIVYRHLEDNGVWEFIASRSMLDNSSYKYENNDDSSEDNLIFDYNSREIYNNFRVERSLFFGNYQLNSGLRYQYIKYSNNSRINIYTNQGPQLIRTNSELDINTYSAYAAISRGFIGEKLEVSLGLNVTGNDYSDEFYSPLKQFSPRLAASFNLTDRWSINTSVGRYFQLPPLTVLGYEQAGKFVNKENDIRPVSADHFVLGVSYITDIESKISIEGYFKNYNSYPFLTRDSVNLANVGGDFGVVGNEPAISEGKGRTYGAEFLYQQKLFKGFYGTVSYTLGVSEFTDAEGNYIPSSWDTRHILNISTGYRFGNNWEVGVSYRFQSQLPMTPFDPASSLVQNWDINNGAIPDYSKLNTERLGNNNLVNLRIDKKWFYDNWNLNLYLDIENVFADAVEMEMLILDRPLNDEGIPIGDGIIENPNAPESEQRYKTKVLNSDAGIIVPTIGLIVEI